MFFQAAHMTNEEDISFDILGRTYIVELTVMQQINEETGTSRAVRRNTVDAVIKKNSSPSDVEVQYL